MRTSISSPKKYSVAYVLSATGETFPSSPQAADLPCGITNRPVGPVGKSSKSRALFSFFFTAITQMV